MAWNLAYNTEDANRFMERAKIRINRRKKLITAEVYDGVYFNDEDIPKGKYQYYCRHSDTDFCKLVSIKKNKGLTVNFFGSIVTDEPIDFNGKDEVSARIWETIYD